MQSSVVVAVAVCSALGAPGCGDAITLEIAGDRPVPTAIDAICVGVADASLTGGQFGRVYRLEGALAGLPQSLRLEPGAAEGAWAWVRGDRGGVPAATAAATIDFSGDVTLGLDRCVRGPAGAPAMIGDAVGPRAARLAASQGVGGTVVVAIGATAEIVDAQTGALVAEAAPAPPAGVVRALVAADLDGDCDDDLVVVTDGAAPALWRRDGRAFADVGTLGGATVAAVAAADVDRDGDIDLVSGAGGTLSLWFNDGGGNFTLDSNGKLSGGGLVSAIRALALADLDGNGNPDLVVGQAGEPLAAWLGQAGTEAGFSPAPAVVPPVPLDVVRLALVDADGDFDPDLAVVERDGGLRLYVDRDGRLEDQSFVRLPQPPPAAHAIAFGGWDAGCEPDAVIASDAAGSALRGTPDGALATEAPTPPATDVLMTDLDDDGDLDAVLAGPEGVVWLAR